MAGPGRPTGRAWPTAPRRCPAASSPAGGDGGPCGGPLCRGPARFPALTCGRANLLCLGSGLWLSAVRPPSDGASLAPCCSAARVTAHERPLCVSASRVFRWGWGRPRCSEATRGPGCPRPHLPCGGDQAHCPGWTSDSPASPCSAVPPATGNLAPVFLGDPEEAFRQRRCPIQPHPGDIGSSGHFWRAVHLTGLPPHG